MPFWRLKKNQNHSSYMKTFTLNDFYFGDKDYPYPMGNVQPVGSFHHEMMKGDAPPLTPTFVLDLLTTHAVPWWLTTEDLPDPDNRVQMSMAGSDWITRPTMWSRSIGSKTSGSIL